MNKIKLLFVFFIGVVIGWLLFDQLAKRNPSPNDKTRFPYLSQKIFTEYDRDLLIHFVPLRTKLREIVNTEYGMDFAMYFEYIPTGTSIGINDGTGFTAGSLLKVPTAMAFFHHREKGNITDDPSVTVKEEHIDKRYGSLWQKAGSDIRLSEALVLSLTESDNTATNVLHDYIEEEDINYVYAGLDLLAGDSNRTFITPKTYTSVLKALFFSAIVSTENSNYILELLSKSKFNDKLAAGIPSNITVSHKIGVYETLNVPIYSDCGIIYAPKRPYMLCMASRSDEETARERMKTISKTVYDFVSSAEPPKK